MSGRSYDFQRFTTADLIRDNATTQSLSRAKSEVHGMGKQPWSIAESTLPSMEPTTGSNFEENGPGPQNGTFQVSRQGTDGSSRVGQTLGWGCLKIGNPPPKKPKLNPGKCCARPIKATSSNVHCNWKSSVDNRFLFKKENPGPGFPLKREPFPKNHFTAYLGRDQIFQLLGRKQNDFSTCKT